MPRHSETKVLPYTAAQMFDLVADVARYPEFLPWTSAARIRSTRPVEGGEEMLADLVISFKVFRERFGSRVTLLRADQRILTEYIDGPFKHLKSVWRFADRPEGGCEVAVDVRVDLGRDGDAEEVGLVSDLLAGVGLDAVSHRQHRHHRTDAHDHALRPAREARGVHGAELRAPPRVEPDADQRDQHDDGQHP